VTTIRAEAQPVQDTVRDDAWDAIVALDREHGQKLYGYALRLGIDAGRAADLVQEALLRLWRELGQGTVMASPEAWTYRTLSPLAMDEHRLSRRIAGLVARLGDRSAPRVMEVDSTDRVAIWSQVDRLPDRQRRVIYLRYQVAGPVPAHRRERGLHAGGPSGARLDVLPVGVAERWASVGPSLANPATSTLMTKQFGLVSGHQDPSAALACDAP
jgi:RNA polymerase sigma-70 factor (ECF subfamily)